MTLDDLRAACAQVEADLQLDPGRILNESELQVELQLALQARCPERLPAQLAAGVIKRGHHPPLQVGRVYRELKPAAGRAAYEADLIVLRNDSQVVIGKDNGAPKGFRPPFAAIIETAVDGGPSWLPFGGASRIRPSKLSDDRMKWADLLGSGKVDGVYNVVLTVEPERFAGHKDVITIRRPTELPDFPSQRDEVGRTSEDVQRAVLAAVYSVYLDYRAAPLGMIREKDFETSIVHALRRDPVAALWRTKIETPRGVINIPAIRTQLSGPWAGILGANRRHDIAVLSIDGRQLDAEIEIKTSHSDSHNWFVKNEVTKEFGQMNLLRANGLVGYALFVMYRYGHPMWVKDAEALVAQHPLVDFRFLGA